MRQIQHILFLLFLIPYFGYSQNKPVFDRMDVFELEWVQNPQISPDGNRIVYQRRGMDIMKDGKYSQLWIIDANGEGHRKLSATERNESNAKWSPDGKKIAYTQSTEQGSEIYVHWLETGVSARLSQLERSPGNLSWSPDGKHLAFSMLIAKSAPKLVSPPSKPKGAKWAAHPLVEDRLKHEADGSGYMQPGYTQLFVISAEGGAARQITTGDYRHGGPILWTADGKNLIFTGNRSEDWDYDFRNSEIYKVDIASGQVTALTSRKGPDGSPALSPDGRSIAYTGYTDRVQTYQTSRLYVMSLDGGKGREIKTGLDRSISSPTWAADGNGIYFMYDDHGNTKVGYTTLEGKTEKVIDNLGGTTIGRPYGGGSYSIGGNDRIAFTRCTPYHPAELAVGERGRSDARQITDLNGNLLPYRNLGQIEEINYKSTFDERDLQGWIVKPPNFDASKKYPLLVENHGGPISNYGDRFSPEVQLFAAAGYVVFYPNPRGSTSYGEEFGNLLYHNYPGEDYIDVMDGVDHLLQRNYLSEDSLYVTGGSAGGIMTAWMIGKNTRFEAAAVVKPVMNWFSKTLVADNYYGYANSRYPGQPWENPEIYMKFSPVSLVGEIETPTLVMVGLSDLRTPLSEAKQLYHALKIRKIPTMLVQIPGSYHNISNRPSQLITKVDHILAWFERYRG